MSLLIAGSACAAIRCGADGGSSQACGVLGPRATHPPSPLPHCRHVQYVTNLEMAFLFFSSAQYATYTAEGGIPFKEDIFYGARCKCITQTDFEECSCPHCTIWREAVRSYHRQRAAWHREAAAAGKTCVGCKCGDPEFLQASKSAGTLRAYLHRTCGKRSLPGLKITEGPKSTELCDFYQRKCCRVPLPELKDAHLQLAAYEAAATAERASPQDGSLQRQTAKLLTAATQTALQMGYSIADLVHSLDCRECGWDACMPHCPLEWDAIKGGTVKKYVPVLQTNGVSVQSELREVQTTRQGLMEHRAPPPRTPVSHTPLFHPRSLSLTPPSTCVSVHTAFDVADAHLFIDEWTTHMRHLSYATVGVDTIIIQTDFSAQYPHKAAWTNTCEHPPTSNMDVFVITRINVDETGIRKSPPPVHMQAWYSTQ